MSIAAYLRLGVNIMLMAETSLWLTTFVSSAAGAAFSLALAELFRRAARWEPRAEYLWRERLSAYREFIGAYAEAGRLVGLADRAEVKGRYADKVADLAAAHIKLSHVATGRTTHSIAPVVELFLQRAAVEVESVEAFNSKLGPRLVIMFDAMRKDIGVEQLDEKDKLLFKPLPAQLLEAINAEAT